MVNNLYVYFETACARHAARLAMAYRPRFRTLRWSYRVLMQHARALAAALEAAGVGPGDRVLLYADSSPYWVAAYFAILARGAVAVPLNPQSPLSQLERIVASAGPKLVCHAARLPWPAASLPAIEITHAAASDREPTSFPGREREPGELAEIIYTSGTTGDPKGVMLTHANLLANIGMVEKLVPILSGDHVLTIIPLFHMYAQMASMLYPLGQGCAVTYLPAPSSRLILDALAQTRITHMVVVPEFLNTVMNLLEQRTGHLPGWLRRLLRPRIRARVSRSLHTIVSGGSALDPEIEHKWRELGYEILQGYGLTETSPVIASNSATEHRPGSVGKVCAGLEVRITGEGEIQVRGPSVMAGYFRDESRTRAAFDGEWLKTDDCGRLDEDGFLYVHGRRKYMILGPGGENVFPEDVEAELGKVTGVREGAVFGLAQHGRTLVHAVLLCEAEGANAAAMIAEANRHLAPHQQIVSWSVWQEPDFPRSATRKPKKEEIIARVIGCAPVHAAVAGVATPLVRVLAQVTGYEASAIHPATRIVPELGVDSLMRIELVSAIEEQLKVVIDENAIMPETTVAELEARLAKQSARAPVVTRSRRWSVAPWASALRPPLRAALVHSWLPFVCRLRVTGDGSLANLEGPVIFMANHQSFLDTPALVMAMPRRIRRRLAIAAGTEVLYARYRWAAPIAELLYNSFPLPTGAEENIKPGLEYTGRLLDQGWSLLIFPEGRMSRGATSLQALKAGAGMLGVEMQVPVVPVAIVGTGHILPPDLLLPRRRGTVEVRFGPPVGVDPAAGYTQATQTIEAALAAMLADES